METTTKQEAATADKTEFHEISLLFAHFVAYCAACGNASQIKIQGSDEQ